MNTLTDKEKILNYIETLDQGDVKIYNTAYKILPWLRSNIAHLESLDIKMIVARDFEDFVDEEFLTRLQLENPNNSYYTVLYRVDIIIWFKNYDIMVQFLEFIQNSNDGNLFSELHEIIGIESRNIYTSINDISVMSIWLTPPTDQTIPSPTIESIFPEG